MKIKFPKQFVKKRPRKPVSSDICLIVHGTVLLHGQQQISITQADESLLTATELAKAARGLLPETTQKERIALALPGIEFVATSLKIPAVAMANPKEVVNLQMPTLLPGVTEQLLLSVEASSDGEQTCALWLPVKRAEELFQAFDKVGLFLNCILPRPLVVLPHTKKPFQVYDEDDKTITYMGWSGNVIQRWLHTLKVDCDESLFQTQLDDALSSFSNEMEQERKTSVSNWQGMPIPSPSAYSYAFIPPHAGLRMAQEARQKKQRQMKVAVGALIVAVIGGLFFANYHKQSLEQRLADLKRKDTISQLRAEVSEIEEMIAPVKKFPHQDVILILEKLNAMIPKTSWITHFHIEWGTVKFEGYSPNPSELIEILSKEPHISNVEITRGTNKERGKEELRFGISLKLKGLNWINYQSEYFSES